MAPVEFSIWDHVTRPPGVGLHELYERRIASVKRAEQAGFARYHIAEHHGHSLAMAPSQFVYLAALARETSTIRLGTMVTCLPLHHPVRLAEEICMADQLSNGRLDWSYGKGISPFEHTMFGHDPAEAPDRTAEMLPMILQALTTGRMTSENSAYFHFPEVALSMEPVQDPYPEMWYPGNFGNAGAQNLNCMVPFPVTAEVRAAFDSAVEANRSNPHRLNPKTDRPKLGSTSFVVIAEDAEEAERLGRAAAVDLLALLGRSSGAEPPHLQQGDPAPIMDPDMARRSSMFVWGTPAQVRDHFVEYARTGHADVMSIGPFPGHLELDIAERSLELFITEVMPAVRAL